MCASFGYLSTHQILHTCTPGRLVCWEGGCGVIGHGYQAWHNMWLCLLRLICIDLYKSHDISSCHRASVSRPFVRTCTTAIATLSGVACLRQLFNLIPTHHNRVHVRAVATIAAVCNPMHPWHTCAASRVADLLRGGNGCHA